FEEPIDYLKSFGDENVHVEDLIYGEDENGQAITLVDCTKYGSLNFNASFAMAKYTISYLFTGIHLASNDAFVFNKVRIKIPLLTQWVNYYGIGYSSSHSGRKMLGYDLKYYLKDQVAVASELSEGIMLSIEHQASIPDTHAE